MLKQRFSAILFASGSLVISQIALADTPHALAVEIPQTEALHDQVSAPEIREPMKFELLASSWEPKQLNIQNSQGVTGTFKSQGIPMFALNVISPLTTRGKLGLLSWRAGLGAYAMEREDTITTAGIVTQTETQKLYILPARVGVEYEPAIGPTEIAAPFLQASLLPTIAMAPRSALSNSITLTGLPYELGAGYSVKPRFLGALSQINAGVVLTEGSLQGQSLYGVGFTAAARISL